MEEELFRREALAARQRPWLGRVRLITPLSAQWGALAALAIFALILAWLVGGHYTRREHVSGSLVPVAGLIELSARTAGTVGRIAAKEGQFVRAGDPLIVLSGEEASRQWGNTYAAVSTQLQSQQARLSEDIASAQRLADEQAASLAQQRHLLQAQLQQLDGQLAIEQHSADTQAAFLARIRPLRKEGYISQLQVQQLETRQAEAASQTKALARQRYDTRQQLNTTLEQLQQLPLNTATKLNELRRQIAQTQQTLLTNENARATVLRSTQGGMVSSLLVRPGQTVTAGQVLLSVVPRGSPLQAQLLVPSRAAGFVRAGSRVALHYQAFPYQKFGMQHGYRLERIAQCFDACRADGLARSKSTGRSDVPGLGRFEDANDSGLRPGRATACGNGPRCRFAAG